MGFRLAIDIGGTFTDFVLVDEEGKITMAKAESNPEKPSLSILHGLEHLCRDLGISLQGLLYRCDLIINGTTIALNTIIKQSGAKTGLLCTKGFRDSLEIRLGHKEKRYHFNYPPPLMLVPRYLRLEVEERINKEGKIFIPLNEENVFRNMEKFKKEGVEAVAVCFIWSFLNPIHEKRAGEIIKAEMPNVFLSLSSEVLPLIREYERTSTTVVNAYVGPALKRYIEEVEELFQSLGYRGEIRYMQSNGGIASGDMIKKGPVLAINSGPSAAPKAGLFFGQVIGTEDILTVDMGGTSFDVCLSRRGETDIIKNVDVHRYRLGIPMININTIGAGGGSIAWIDDRGILRIGPHSAEAIPGPVCYMKGGKEPTVTDANVALGYLNPDYLLGGEVRIDGRASKEAILEKIAKPLGLTLERASLGIFNLVNNNMARAISEVSVQRGYDPRDFTLVAAGGCGPVHAGRLASEMGVRKVIIPKLASTFCAFGEIVADIRHDYGWSYTCRFDEIDLDKLNDMFQQMEEEGYRDLEREGISREDVYIVRTMDIRYIHQVHECTIAIPSYRLTQERIPEILDIFHKRHEALYAYCERESPCELINIGCTVYGGVPEVRTTEKPKMGKDPSNAIKGERPAYFAEMEDYVITPIFDGDRIQPRNIIKGPAIVEEITTTIVVFPAFSLELDGRGFYLLEVSV